MIVVGQVVRYGHKVRNVVCERCGLSYISPRPSLADMADFYRREYRAEHEVPVRLENGAIVEKGTSEHQETKNEKTRIQAHNAAVAGGTKEGSRVLEIGCQDGATLRLMMEQLNIEAIGIEPDVNEATIAAERGVSVYRGVFEDFDPGEKLFDQIQMFQVLEHMHAPLETLVRIRALLKPTGRLVVEVPNLSQPYGALEENFFQLPHLYNFNLNTLTAFFRRAGLHVLGWRSDQALTIAGEVDPAASSPVPFQPEMLPLEHENGHWVATRLATYAKLEKAMHTLKNHSTIHSESEFMALFSKSAFPEHLSRSINEATELLLRFGRPDLRTKLLQSAISGPHSNAVMQQCEDLLSRKPS